MNETSGPEPARRRPRVNITPLERIGRVAVGTAAVIAGLLLLTSAASVLAVVLELLLVAAGLDLVVTGAIGHCRSTAGSATCRVR